MMARPELLTHPPLPRPMHGVAPRNIRTGYWWQAQRRQAFEKTGDRCAACGVHKRDAMFHQWLEAHECFDIDYERGKMRFIEVVGLCHACHMFIHSERLRHMLDIGHVSESRYRTIQQHGNAVLKAAGMKRYPPPELKVPWSEWRMVLYGSEYPPKHANEEAWRSYYDAKDSELEDADE